MTAVNIAPDRSVTGRREGCDEIAAAPTPAQLVALGEQLAATGTAEHEFAIHRVVRAGRAVSIGVAAEVLADTTAPEIARLRAFAVVSAALSRRQAVAAPRSVA